MHTFYFDILLWAYAAVCKKDFNLILRFKILNTNSEIRGLTYTSCS
jgi:hypothetical protein